MQLLELLLGYFSLLSVAQGGAGVRSPPEPPGKYDQYGGDTGEATTAVSSSVLLSSSPPSAAESEGAEAAGNGGDRAGFQTTKTLEIEQIWGRRRRRRQEEEHSNQKQRQEQQQEQEREPATGDFITSVGAEPFGEGVEGPMSASRKGQKRTLTAEVEVTEEAGGEGDGGEVGRPLVPSVCPTEPFEAYAALHRSIVEGTLAPRYLVYRPYLYCGMGNRLKGFRGVMALAMLTDRALLVDWYGGLDSSRDRTAHKYEDNFLESQGIPWDHFPPVMEDYENFGGSASSTEVWCQMPNAIGITTPCDGTRLVADFLSAAEWTQIYAEDKQVVIVQAHNHNPMDYLRLNEDPGVLEALSRLDRSVSPSVFGTCALRFLFKARQEFRDRFCNDRLSVLNGKIPSVALHIRTGDNPNYHPEWYETLPQDIEKFVQCATGFDEGLAMVASNYSSGPDYDYFSIFGEGVDSVWLLGTDSSEAIDFLKEGHHMLESGGKVVFIEGDEFHRAHSGTKGGRASNNAGPIIDLALLSEALLLIGSVGSTFSDNAAVVGGLPLPFRLSVSTPFRHIVSEGKNAPWDIFEDYHQGCRDLVSNPSYREDLRVALKMLREPWIDCGERGERMRI